MDVKEYVDLYHGKKYLSNEPDPIAGYFGRRYPEIEKSIDQTIVTADELDSLPNFITCKVHGDYELKYNQFYTKDKFQINSVCPKCVDERDAALVKFKKEVEEEIKLRSLVSKLEGSGLKKRHWNKTFDNYIADTEQKQKALSKCRKLTEQIKKSQEVNNLIMIGGVGTGKTHLASSILRDLIENGKRCELWTLIDIIRSLKATWKKDAVCSEDEMLDHFSTLPLLIIDEVGVQFGSDTEKMFVFDIINGRYENMLPNVIISNLDIEGVKDIIGERCIDRLREDGGQVVAFNWQSHRGIK